MRILRAWLARGGGRGGGPAMIAYDALLWVDWLCRLLGRGHLPAPLEGAPQERDRAPRRLRPDEVEEAPAQLLLGQVALDAASDDERDGAGLLAHHHHHRIGLLADADRRPVARPVALAVEHVLAQREEHTGGRDALARDEYGTVVERRAVVEDRDQQLRPQVGVDRHTRLGGEILEPGLALERDERPVA